jgi:hypothetical protein
MLAKAIKSPARRSRRKVVRKKTDASKVAPRGINMAVALRDFIGCFEGPGDLSTNKKYFENFGR